MKFFEALTFDVRRHFNSVSNVNVYTFVFD